MSNNAAHLYRKLCRLRVQRARIQARIARLERTLAGKTARWGSCSSQRNRK